MCVRVRAGVEEIRSLYLVNQTYFSVRGEKRTTVFLDRFSTRTGKIRLVVMDG